MADVRTYDDGWCRAACDDCGWISHVARKSVGKVLAERHRCAVLYCGHPDDDPDVWHHSDDHGGPVCATCCPTCNKERES